ncbi:class I lanthipeptide [Chitinophaga qingshengii]|uniref:Class I lanthipeptide n=1 Tax=Chitinophaga qingshengii TaxID=1569794 RepID=A0ABR7TXN4_9BACT|nr:class I lanthipeptide [Chitinophaga qingshengii]MBC9934437.1 class I lanthipeptide [Chitinophaga qingshengii]
MKKKKIDLKKKLMLKKETLTTLTPGEQGLLVGGLLATRLACETRPITGSPVCYQCP